MNQMTPMRHDVAPSASGDACEAAVSPARARLAAVGRIVAAHPTIVVAAVTIVATAMLFAVPLCADVTWQLWIAHDVRMGARLYFDIVETNPPLWYWMAVPVDAVAGWLRIAPGAVLIPALGLVTLASLGATERLIRHIPAARRVALLAYAVLALLIMPAWMTGQREQLLLIAALPYVALVAARREARMVSPWLAAGIGAGAALGFALKHYFLIVPVLLELWLIVGQRRGWRPIRPETLLVALVGAGYAAAILIATPDFLTTIVPMLRLSYGEMGAKSLSDLFQVPQYLWIGSLLILLLHRRHLGRTTPFAGALLVASAGFCAAWAIQHKGWAYQGIATSGGLALALAAFMAETGRWLNPVAPAMLAAPVLFGWHGDALVNVHRDELAGLAAEVRPGDTVGIISRDPTMSWPLTSERQLRYPSRYYGYWMLTAVDEHERRDRDPRLAALGRKVVRDTVIDYRCMPPSRIVFAHWPHVTGFDIASFFGRDPAFRDLMTHYRRERWTGRIDVFRQVSALQPIDVRACRPGV